MKTGRASLPGHPLTVMAQVNDTLLLILAELQALTAAETGLLAVMDDGVRAIMGGFIAIVVIHAVDTWFRRF